MEEGSAGVMMVEQDELMLGMAGEGEGELERPVELEMRAIAVRISLALDGQDLLTVGQSNGGFEGCLEPPVPRKGLPLKHHTRAVLRKGMASTFIDQAQNHRQVQVEFDTDPSNGWLEGCQFQGAFQQVNLAFRISSGQRRLTDEEIVDGRIGDECNADLKAPSVGVAPERDVIRSARGRKVGGGDRSRNSLRRTKKRFIARRFCWHGLQGEHPGEDGWDKVTHQRCGTITDGSWR